MIKKLFIVNQFIFISIVLMLILSHLVFNYGDSNKYFLKCIDNAYDISYVNQVYIVSSFSGSGGFLYGGVVPQKELPDISSLKIQQVDEIVKNESIYHFPELSFPDGGLYIKNMDLDKGIEVFAFEVAGKNIMSPFEITLNGEVHEENIIVTSLVCILASFWMLPMVVLYVVFGFYYLLVFISYIGQVIKYRISKEKKYLTTASSRFGARK